MRTFLDAAVSRWWWILSATLSSIHILTLQPGFGAQAQSDRSFMGISTRDIAELTQIATDLAAQTMQSNKELLSKPGRPEVRPLSLNASPSEMISQGLTNMWEPATQQFAKALASPMQPNAGLSLFGGGKTPPDSAPSSPAKQQGPSLGGGALSALFKQRQETASEPISGDFETAAATMRRDSGSGAQQINSIMELANTFLGGGRKQRTESDDGDGGGGGIAGMTRLFSSNGASSSGGGGQRRPMMIPNLKQLFPGANGNFGVRQGEGCLPFIEEFMKIAYGNCARQAEEKTWDAWGKEITNALMGGKIDLLRASKETCKKTQEREQCGQLKRAVSECDIIASIQLAANMQRSVSRCDEISGIIDQNPMTVLSHMNGMINGEMAQGLLNNFLG